MNEDVKPQLPATFARRNAQGLIEIVCMHTGRVLVVQRSLGDLLATRAEELVKIDTPDGPVFLERGIGVQALRQRKQRAFSQIHADLLIQEVANGSSLMKAADEFNLHYADVCRWRRENAGFATALEEARKDRAEAFHDEAIDSARASFDTKLKVETLKWAAEKGDTDKFGHKTKIQGDPNAPLSFVIDTGIRRPGDPGYVKPAEEKVVEQEKQIEAPKGDYDV